MFAGSAGKLTATAGVKKITEKHMGRAVDKVLDIVADNPILGIAVLAITAYVVVEVVAIIVLHHTVNF
jgi:cation transporter-like permease